MWMSGGALISTIGRDEGPDPERRSPGVTQRQPMPSGLHGRADEWSALARALQRAAVGRAQVVLLEGDAGMGKSTLFQAFAETVQTHGRSSVCWLRCDEREQSLEFASAEVLMGNGALEQLSEIEVGRRLLARLSELQGRSGPAVVLVDDAQWIDAGTAHALRFAVRRLSADHVLVVLARRPVPASRAEPWTGDPRDTTSLTLSAFDSRTITAWVRRLRGWDLTAAAAAALCRRSGGQPLMVAALVHSAAKPGDLQDDRTLAASLAMTIERRLLSASAETRRLVEAVATMGEARGLVVLAQVAQLDDPGSAAEEALTAGLVRYSESGGLVCFHSLVRDAVYSTLTAKRRRALHRRAADASTGDRRLDHLVKATDRADPALVAQLRDAADAARRGEAFELAADHRLRARSVCVDAEQSDVLLLEALIDLVNAQHLVRAESLEPEARGCTPCALRSLALGLLAREKGDPARAQPLLREAVELARADTSASRIPQLDTRAAHALAALLTLLDDGPAALTVLATVDSCDDPELATDLLTTTGTSPWQAGRIDEATTLLTDRAPADLATPWGADLLAVRGMLRLYSGDLRAALADLDTRVRLTSVWRPSTFESRGHIVRARIRSLLGDWDGATVDTAAARALAERRATPWGLSMAHAISIDVPAWRGQWAAAEAHLDAAREILTSVPEPRAVDYVVFHEVVLASTRSDYEVVVELLDHQPPEFLDRAVRMGVHRSVMQTWIDACLELGDRPRARRVLATYESQSAGSVGGSTDTGRPTGVGWGGRSQDEASCRFRR